MKDVVFEQKNDLVNYLYSLLDNPTQIKVQKTMYLLFAYYGATYGNLESDSSENDFEGQSYPKYLFEPQFEAWRYGPVDYEIYQNEKKNVYEKDSTFPTTSLNEQENKNIQGFIKNIVSQTNNIDDFSLVDRTHQDNSWRLAYKEDSSPTKMNADDVINEYKDRYIS